MLTVITKAGRLLIAAVFAVALMFGLSQTVRASNSLPCDTPHGVCNNNENCDEACAKEGYTMGGECQSPEQCCICYQ